MNICQKHWDKLRAKIEEAGLMDLVADSGELAVEQLKDQLEKGESDKVNYDPLMSAYFAIGSNGMDIIANHTPGNALYLLTQGPEDPVEGFPGYEDRTWPKCTICYLNLAHEMTCTGCELPKIGGFEYFIDRAVEDQIARAKELGLKG